MKKRIYLTSNDKVTKDENNLVNVTLADGTVANALEPRRLFPVSSLDTYITLLDEEGVEFAIIKALSELDRDSRKVVEDSLDDYYLVPKIIKIINTEEKSFYFGDKYEKIPEQVQTLLDDGIITRLEKSENKVPPKSNFVGLNLR